MIMVAVALFHSGEAKLYQNILNFFMKFSDFTAGKQIRVVVLFIGLLIRFI